MRHVKFSDVITRANTKEDRFNTDKLYYVGGEHIDSQELLVNNKGLIKGSTIGPMFYCGFKAGQVLFVTRNPHLRKCSAVTFDGICSEKTFVLETKDPTILLQSYLMVVMQSDEFWEYCEENKSGGVNYFINWSTLAEYEFDLPSIEDQESIAKKLWAAYEVKQSYVNMIAATDEMVKSQFIEMFKDSPKSAISDFCKVEKGTTITRNEVIEGNIPVVAGGQEPSCYHNVANRKAGVITISASGAYSGFVNYWTTQIFASDCNTIIPIDEKNTNVHFLYHGLKAIQKEIYSLQKGGAQPHVYGKDIEKFLFPYPTKEEQDQFADIAQQADKSKFELKKAIEAIDKVIKSLINENL